MTPSLTIAFRRAEVAGFWLVTTGLVSLSIGLMAFVRGAPAPAAWATAAAIGLVLPGLVWRPWFETGVWFWNGSMRRVAAALRTYVLAVSYYTLFTAIACGGSSFDPGKRRPARSTWHERDRLASHQDDRVWWPFARRTHGLAAFARTAGNTWAVTLFPLVFLLTLLRDDEQEDAVPGSTYTLY